MKEVMSEQSVLRSSAVMALGTLISRITGLARNLLLVTALGTAIIGDTYQIANSLPTVVYILVAGGALNAVFVPQIIREMKNKDGGHSYTSQLATATFTILGFATVIGIIAAPLIVRLYATKFGGAGLQNEFELTVLFTRYCLPQVLFLGLFTLLGQIANARGSFGPMMWAPILNNLVVIGVLVGFIVMAPDAANGVMSTAAKTLLGVGTSLGALVQAAILIPVISKAGVRLRPNFHWSFLRKSAHLAKWTLIFVLINQIGFIFIVNLATSASVRAKQSGINIGVGFTPYQNASFIFMLPHSIIAVSFVTALLPRISRFASEARITDVRDDIEKTLLHLYSLIVPAAFALLFLSQPIAHFIFAGSRSADASQIGLILSGFALGLIPFCSSYLMLRGFYAFEDTRTPAGITLVMNILTVIAATIGYFVLPTRFITVGIAISFGIGYLASSLWARYLLTKRIGGMSLRRDLISIIVVSAIAFAPSLLISRISNDLLNSGVPNLISSVVTLVISGLVAMPIYLVLGYRLQITPITSVGGSVRKRLSKGN
jgi:putative peptidoglycan lipid II flippase